MDIRTSKSARTVHGSVRKRTEVQVARVCGLIPNIVGSPREIISEAREFFHQDEKKLEESLVSM